MATTFVTDPATDPGAAARRCIRDGCDERPTRVTYPGQRFTCARHVLHALPTITQGHDADLKYEEDGVRVWLSRMTTADGADHDRGAIVEHHTGGTWALWGGVPLDGPEPTTSRVYVALPVADALRATGLVDIAQVTA